jgi:hypothetical protein
MNGANDLIPIKAGMPRSVLSGKPRLENGVRVWAFRCAERSSSAAAVLKPAEIKRWMSG